MAIINCPSCKARISDKAHTCSHCGYDLAGKNSSEDLSPEKMESQARLAHMKKRHSLQMQAMAGIILFLLGIMLWYFLGERGLSEVSHFIEVGIALLGGFWYLLTRVRLIMFKKGQ